MDGMLRDVRHSLRSLFQKPTLTLFAVLALALGIGANTAIFSIVNAVLLKPIPVSNPGRVVMVYDHQKGAADDRSMVSPGDFLDWKAQSSVFAAFSPAGYQYYNITGHGIPTSQLGARVSSDFFKIMDMKPLLGRGIQPDEDAADKSKVVVVRHSFWKKYLGGDPAIVGKALSLNGDPYTVIGVMPPGYVYPTSAQLWVPVAFTPKEEAIRWRYLFTIGRLKPGATTESAQRELSAIASRLEQQYPDSNTHWGVNVVPLREVVVGKTRTGILALMGTVALVLLIACANVASLLLARASQRSHEVSLRLALGASRANVTRQFLIEGVLLALFGGALGLILSSVSKQFLLDLLSTVPRQDEITVDVRVLLITILLSLVTGIIAGLAPVSQTFRLDLVSAFKEARGRSSSGQTRRPLKTLLVAEVALTMMVLITAALLLRSLANLRAVDLGFNPSHVVMAPFALPSSTPRYDSISKRNAFFDEVQQRAAVLPGVTSVGAINQPPLMWPATVSSVVFKDRPTPPKGEEPTANIRIVSGDYFGTMQIPLVQGRKFSTADTENSPPVAIVNRKMADSYWPGQSALGKRFTFKDQDWEVVGIVANVRERGITEDITPSVYTPLAQNHIDDLTYMVRTSGDPRPYIESMRKVIWGLDSELPLDELTTWDDHLAQAIAEPRSKTVLLSLFALLALLLAALGIYGIFAYSVSERTNEIGVRVALGAQRSSIFRLISGQGLTLTLIGIVIGVAGSLAASRVIASLLFGVSAADLLVYVFTAGFLLIIAFLATFVPAWRATQTDPLVAIRYE
ncbi:MAG: ABC transporter permease [Acidobacteria bacterium]|nr:ABC transporter permease [Acidobacteriota bacterium]